MIESNLNILWISDIHFSEAYKKPFDAIAFDSYMESFRAKIEAQISQDSGIDYIFLTGDIAQSGSKEDYMLFMEKFLAPLLDLFLVDNTSNPKIITIPGNHDVNLKNGAFLTEYLNKIIPALKTNVDRSEYLKDHYSDFKELFSGYRQFVNETVVNYSNGKYQNFFGFDSTSEYIISTEYKDSRLQGYIVDYAKRLVIVMLNTAWFSLGSGFDKLYAAEIAKETDWNDSNREQKVMDILKKKAYISEYNNQITGINTFEYKELLAILDQYKDYFVITCMHHPTNWLQWNEIYTYEKPDRNDNANKLNKLLQSSNLILSGHEHIPKNIHIERLGPGTVSLKSGCFLFDNQHKKNKLDNGWFSILKIHTDRAFIMQDKHYYDTEKNWNIDDQNFSGAHPIIKTHNGYNLDQERLKRLGSQFLTGPGEKLKRFLASLLPHEIELTALNEFDTIANDYFRIFRITRSDHEEICFMAKKPSVYWLMNTQKFCEIVDQVMKEVQFEISVIRFAILDLYVDEPDITQLSKGELKKYSSLDMEEKLSQIVNFADSMFDVFRYQFFVRFDTDVIDVSKKEKQDMFNHYQDIRFINTIIPFYLAENFWIKE